MDHLTPKTTTSLTRRRRRSSSSNSNVSETPKEFGQMRQHRDPRSGSVSASFVGSGSGIHFVRTVRRAFNKSNATRSVNIEASDDELVPGEDDRLSNPTTLWNDYEVQVLEPGGPQSCNFEDLVRWTRSYFDFWHPLFPFLHAPTVLESMENLAENGPAGLSVFEMIIIRAIMSISLGDRRQMPQVEGLTVPPAHLIFQSINDAILATQSMMILPSDFGQLQAILSVQLFLISMLGLNAASRMGGLVIRMVYHLGLHRCPARYKQFSAIEIELRRRVFWAVYCIERYLAQALGTPLDLRDDDTDVCHHDKELHNPSGTSGIINPGEYLLLPTYFAKHGKIKGLILELRNKSISFRRTDPDDVAYIDAEILRWWNEAQDLIDPLSSNELIWGKTATSTNASNFSLKPLHSLLLLVQKHESVILLNRPIISSGSNTASFSVAMQKCIGASKAIIHNVYSHLVRESQRQGSEDGRVSDPLIWPGFVGMVWQSALILLYGASGGFYSVLVAQRDANRAVAILENLTLRGSFWPGSCAAAIKELQSALNRRTVAPDHIVQNPPMFVPSSHGNGEGVNEAHTTHRADYARRRNQKRGGSRATRPPYPPVPRRARDCRSQPANDNAMESSPAATITSFSHAETPPQGLPVDTSWPGVPSSYVGTSTTNNHASITGHNLWTGTDSNMEGFQDLGNEMYDLFQLMDTSYLVGDHQMPFQSDILSDPRFPHQSPGQYPPENH
ncbi:hypothetical protein BP5796_09815 [Coleophoma crateriformis]|uniref:Xylanolytic transcriptional activator regulatory domain-containing protein n=1 Tax=Coleophoma crateriformis TaxID=565419 RepID=A0A3D8QZ38_9HELO|nr:hypothetical protein BP5796_09815 [Coleophoma crateriformis]